MFPGIKERLTKEIKEQIPESVDVKIIAPPERMYSVWIGGSILSSLKTFHRMWVTRREKVEGFASSSRLQRDGPTSYPQMFLNGFAIIKN